MSFSPTNFSTPFQSPGLSFCTLEERVIVLDPSQGLYFSLSAELGRLLQSLPVQSAPAVVKNLESSATPTSHATAFSQREYELLKNLTQAGLVNCQQDLIPKHPASREYFITDDLKVWGTLAELTQSGGGSGTTVGGGPGMTFPPL